MDEIVRKALAYWGLENAPTWLVAARENTVYRVATDEGPAALRLHRQGYRRKSELFSELAWMAAMARAGISTAAPMPALDGALVHSVSGVEVDMLHWLSGQPMPLKMKSMDRNQRSDLFFALGREMANLHHACDAWTLPAGFDRVHWNREGLLGEAPLWDRFWENPILNMADRKLLQRFRDHANTILARHCEQMDYGLIHADLVPDNILVGERELHLIDFDDGGFGYRLFDIATVLWKHEAAPDFDCLKKSLVEGYHARRPLDIALLDLFFALRAVTYLGWNITRINEAGGFERNQRFMKTAGEQIARYFSNGINGVQGD